MLASHTAILGMPKYMMILFFKTKPVGFRVIHLQCKTHKQDSNHPSRCNQVAYQNPIGPNGTVFNYMWVGIKA